MIRQRLPETIIGICAIGLLVGGLLLLQQQERVDLPPQQPARRLDGAAAAPVAVAPVLPTPAVRSMPAQSPGSWLSDADYPVEAMRREWQGVAGFALTINADGVVTDCVITQTAGHAILDEATCRILKRNARFTPARDASGTAVADTYNGRVSWRLPD